VIQKLTAFSGQIFSKLSQNDHPTNLLAIRLVVAFFSALLTIVAIATDDIINLDGVLYINMADAFLERGLSGAASIYNWPFYSISAAGISNLTGLSTLSSYYFLNTILFVCVTDSFLLLSSKQLRTDKSLSVAAIIILCLFSLNEYRDFIIRDIGYWAFTLYGLYHFIIYFEKLKFCSLFFWQCSFIIATMFRIEGIILLFILPLFLLYKLPIKQSFKHLLYCYLWMLIICLTCLITQQLGGHDFNAFSKLAELKTYINGNKHLEFFSSASMMIDTKLLHPVVQEQGYGEVILASGFFSITIFEIISALSVTYFILLIMAIKHRTESLQSPNSQFLLFILVIQFILLLTFFLTSQIQTTRYCLLAGMILLLWCLPTLTSYILEAFKNKRILPLLGICFIFIYTTVDAFHHSSSKQYFIDDLKSLAAKIPDSETVMTNNKLIGFYLNQSNPSLDIIFKRNLKLSKAGSYLVIEPHRMKQNKVALIENSYIMIDSLGTSKRPISLYKKKKRP
jgi:hypothetical protein